MITGDGQTQWHCDSLHISLERGANTEPFDAVQQRAGPDPARAPVSPSRANTLSEEKSDGFSRLILERKK
ncbi:hypothetical protein SZ55_3009 [Pseudomonas sp. FeS53a]|nr:hypothetical protein SZ55_3009 [Pseudomonas sp. FeS53a]